MQSPIARPCKNLTDSLEPLRRRRLLGRWGRLSDAPRWDPCLRWAWWRSTGPFWMNG